MQVVDRFPTEIVSFLTDCGVFSRHTEPGRSVNDDNVAGQAAAHEPHFFVPEVAESDADGCGVEVSAAEEEAHCHSQIDEEEQEAEEKRESEKRARVRSGTRRAGRERRKTEMIVETFTIKV
jgi:hypothetical protein